MSVTPIASVTNDHAIAAAGPIASVTNDPAIAAAGRVVQFAAGAESHMENVPWAVRVSGVDYPIGGVGETVPGNFGSELAVPLSAMREQGIASVAQAIKDSSEKAGFPAKVQDSGRRAGRGLLGGGTEFMFVELGCKYSGRGKRAGDTDGRGGERKRRGRKRELQRFVPWAFHIFISVFAGVLRNCSAPVPTAHLGRACCGLGKCRL